MPSGFLILADGRSFAARWRYYDLTLQAIAEELDYSTPEKALRDWVLSLIPGPSDIEELGYGAWVRSSDQQIIQRYLDVRELTLENQRLFHRAALRAGKRGASPEAANLDPMMVECLLHLADLVECAERGEPPLSKSDWVEMVPSKGRKEGPGWPSG